VGTTVHNELNTIFEWIEIVKVRTDRKVMLLRLPAAWCRANGILPGEYFTLKPDGDGGLHLRTLSKELDYAKKSEKYPFKRDKSGRLSDEGIT